MASAPKVFSIPVGAAFLPSLLDSLFAGRFGPVDPGNPLSFADVTILLPTRRAVRALSELFVERMGGNAILPRIRPIGDVDEDEFLFEPPGEQGAELLLLPQAVGALERRLELARLILAWGKAVRRDALGIGSDEPILIPASPADAMRLAGDLARLIDEMAAAGISWDGLRDLGAADYPLYWQLTLKFLQIASKFWPERLVELGQVDPATRRDRLIRAEAARLAADPPSAIFIAAGSTGSIPATAELLSVIARLPSGAVILPGLDQTLDPPAFEAIGGAGQTPVPGHPQYGLRQLLPNLGVTRDDVVELGGRSAAMEARSRILSEALRPAETTEAWGKVGPVESVALEGISLLAGRSEVEEALAVALVLRHAVEEGKVAALVTPDRTIARRVAAELRRFHLEIDDSAGIPLASTPPANFVRLLIDAVVADGDPVKLLALLRHPLASFGLARAECRAAARIVERALFRGGRVTGGIAGLPGALAQARKTDARRSERSSAPSQADWRLAEKLGKALSASLMGLATLAGRVATVAEITEGLVAALRRAGIDESDRDDEIWTGKSGEALAALLEGLVNAGSALTLSLAEYSGLFLAAMEGIKVTAPPTADARIHIWGTLEARLQSADIVILAGLDEGIWPAESRTDPWLSRPMRAALGLDAPERRIGLAAHDFVEGMGASHVWVTRAAKRAGTPTVASRWLQRLLAVVGPSGAERLKVAGDSWLDLARRLDRVSGDAVGPIPRPAPRPPVSLRPRTLSITEIETLVRDPYAIYARHVLGLWPLQELGRPPDAALRGTLIHDALAAFTASWQGAYDADAEAALLRLMRDRFEPLAAFPAVHALWWLRAQAIGRWFVNWERRRSGIAERSSEISGALDLVGPAGAFRLRGRADRIDLRRDGAVEIYDFKTGTPPSAKQVLSGFSPQLGLEAAMVHAGAFGAGFGDRPITALAWIALGRAGKGDEVRSATGNSGRPESVGAATLAQMNALIQAYDDPGRPYRSLERPMFEHRWRGDYDHLARIGEWRLARGEDDE